MASSLTGKICMLVLLFFSMSICREFVTCSPAPVTENPLVSADGGDSTTLYSKQQAQIDKLEQLVKNLTELVARLESNQYESPGIGKVKETLDLDGSDIREKRLVTREVEKTEGRSKTVASVTKYNGFWSEQFWFVSAVNLDSKVTSLTVLPFRDHEDNSKYVAIGDDRGRVYVLMRNGEVLVEFYTLSDSPVTSMVSYISVYKNESIVVTGHGNGLIFVHRIWESSSGDEWSSLKMENVVALDSVGVNEIGSSVSILEVHYVGRSRFVLSADKKGTIKVFRENGDLHGVAVPSSRPLAFLKQRLLFLTETGAGSLDLRTMKIKEVDCEGLNRSSVKHYAFDPTERLKAYGITSSGELIHALLMGDVTNFKCRVRSWKNTNVNEALGFQVIKGYLLIIDHEKLYVYNISSQHYARTGSPRFVFSTGIDDIRSSFAADKAMSDQRVPLIASDRARLVVFGFGGGCVGMYRSNLPVMKGESSSMLWTTPVLFFVLFLFGLWHFFAKKKESLTLWGSDDPFSTTTTTSVAKEAVPDATDMRNNGFGGSRSRYGSPTRYPVVGGNSYRPNSVDTSSRSTELTYRGSNVESSGFPIRRENMYVKNQGLDETS